MGMPCVPLGHADNFRKCIDAKLGFGRVFPSEHSIRLSVVISYYK